ncbi:MAG: serine/threonine protein kinase [Planctomycetaceae bacterium]|nr:MAG: serine/threonine protein kinase [Planctomycetaceae bacterium]
MKHLLRMIVLGLWALGMWEHRVASLWGDDWPQFRGPNGAAVSPEPAPLQWHDGEQPEQRAQIAWKVPLPGRGLSCPIVVGERVFVTCSSGYRQDRLHVLCFAQADGRLLWERQFWATGRTVTHPKTCVAANTPVSDGQHVFAQFSSNDVLALTLEGELLWTRGITLDYPNVSNSLGMAASPVLAGRTLIIPAENDSQSLTLGLDPATGRSRWVLERPRRANWTTPAVLRGSRPEQDVVLLQSSAGLTAVAPDSGQILDNYTDGAATIPSAVVSQHVVYVPSHGITALAWPTESVHFERLWRGERLNPATPSPVVWRDKLYIVNGAGVLVCANLATGQVVWQRRLEGPFTASPVIAGHHLYLFNETGKGQVVDLSSDGGDVVGGGELHDTILATPALSRGALYVRSDRWLWKIAP